MGRKHLASGRSTGAGSICALCALSHLCLWAKSVRTKSQWDRSNNCVLLLILNASLSFCPFFSPPPPPATCLCNDFPSVPSNTMHCCQACSAGKIAIAKFQNRIAPSQPATLKESVISFPAPSICRHCQFCNYNLHQPILWILCRNVFVFDLNFKHTRHMHKNKNFCLTRKVWNCFSSSSDTWLSPRRPLDEHTHKKTSAQCV